MYKKGVALEIQFSPERLNDGAGDPYWIDLSADEAAALLNTLQTQLGRHAAGTAAPLVVTLDEPKDASAETPADASTRNEAASTAADDGFKQWVCVICGWVYDEAAGAPDDGLPPGTRWADVPDDWRCPLCDVGKEDFALVEF
ncbi:rubredoxin [Paraburkholderia caballeronis]|uniref:rubredoxin n=1 Tax=Paraburkholderia caballeronis TaxID=416943 RepID=UPI001065DB1C|nr:rubredoxin [Paraburkholderia caballeronis]TDV15106.1 rubredoxin [Paraburkholderia caballeronis]TDV16769.1 rubredoxin [Paraburkholderia caballeronis]TDV25842.1 rubredoxin [Paraburkholderia caballeronis]